MAPSRQYGPKLVFGVPDRLQPIIPRLPGKMRIRLRNKDFAKVFFKTNEGIRCFCLEENGNHWTPIYEQGRNFRDQSMDGLSMGYANDPNSFQSIVKQVNER